MRGEKLKETDRQRRKKRASKLIYLKEKRSERLTLPRYRKIPTGSWEGMREGTSLQWS